MVLYTLKFSDQTSAKTMFSTTDLLIYPYKSRKMILERPFANNLGLNKLVHSKRSPKTG